jgi:hypothetical protein
MSRARHLFDMIMHLPWGFRLGLPFIVVALVIVDIAETVRPKKNPLLEDYWKEI